MFISRNELRAIQEWQRAIWKALGEIQKEIKAMSAALDRLTSEVSRNTTVIGSAVALIQGLAQQIRDAAADPAAVTALADQLMASTDAMASAIAANTPAE